VKDFEMIWSVPAFLPGLARHRIEPVDNLLFRLGFFIVSSNNAQTKLKKESIDQKDINSKRKAQSIRTGP
jgi:hypothetical protein